MKYLKLARTQLSLFQETRRETLVQRNFLT
jgi:hypothetical protein